MIKIVHFLSYKFCTLDSKYWYKRKIMEFTPFQDTTCPGYAQYIGQLSKRELEVIEAVLSGCVSQKELAVKLDISVNTVKKHLQHIYKTTGAVNMTALTILFSGYSQKRL